MAEYGHLQTTRSDGDFAVDADGIGDRRRSRVDREWTWLRQVHGSDVVVVSEPGQHAGQDADAAVSLRDDVVLCVQTADCVSVTFTSGTHGAFGVAHAGWRGVRAGVIEETIAALETLGTPRRDLIAKIGPHISAAHYEFGQQELTELALQFGPDVIGATVAGDAALDVGAAVRSALHTAGVGNIDATGVECTASALDQSGAPRFFSHRQRTDTGRMTTAVWRIR